MTLPFTEDQFFAVFENYNSAIWPAQIMAYLLGGLAIVLAFGNASYRGRVISAVLAIFWIWMGIAYHWVYFSAINKAAYLFGLGFILQGLLFLWFGVIKGNLSFGYQKNFNGLVGSLFIIYSTVVYPLLGQALGHEYPITPMFGVAPCPTTIFTFGLFLWAPTGVSWQLIVIPFLWSLIGFTAAFLLSVREDFGLLVASILGLILLAAQHRRRTIHGEQIS